MALDPIDRRCVRRSRVRVENFRRNAQSERKKWREVARAGVFSFLLSDWREPLSGWLGDARWSAAGAVELG